MREDGVAIFGFIGAIDHTVCRKHNAVASEVTHNLEGVAAIRL